MKTIRTLSAFFTIVIGAWLLSACLLPGMIPLEAESTQTPEAAEPVEPRATVATDGSMPTMETDPDALLEKLRAGEFVYLQQLAEENYKQADFDKPGTLTITNNDVPDDKLNNLEYGWCTTTEEILNQNFEHIRIGLYFNEQQLGRDVVHPVQFTRPDGFICLDFGVLMSDWPPGEYTLRSVVTFDQKINDGAADFEAGDYIHEYHVTVK